MKPASELPPDLVLVDIRLADPSSGNDASDGILGACSGTPVTFVTVCP